MSYFQRRSRPMSRLYLAWLALFGALAAGVVAAVLTPERPLAPTELVIELPSQPDPFAASPVDLRTPVAVALGSPSPAPVTGNAALSGPEPLDTGPVEPVRMATLTPVPDADQPSVTMNEVLADEGPGAVIITMPTPNAEAAQPDEVAQPASIVLVVGGLGVNRALTDRAIDVLPPSTVLSFTPYAADLDAHIARAKAKGHQVAIEIPMEDAAVPISALGSAALMLDRNPNANLERLSWIMSRAENADFLTNYFGAGFLVDGNNRAMVVGHIAQAGMQVLDDTGRLGQSAAPGVVLPVDDLVLSQGDQLASRLDRLVSDARLDGVPRTVKVYLGNSGLEPIDQWAQTLENREVSLIPLEDG